ncbi:uncharacterized protein LOC106153554, partial [Lingula anatina]|uniref:Uncharacterized protein LOC106153554 n=1 Tax=Lingula anatina TaxID=7574 RepID=A0A1S3HA60_LINAN
MPGPGKQAVFVNPFKPENRNIGRRTGRDVRAGKNIRIFHDGIENFDDYWSDSDASTLDSDDKWLKEKENEKRIKGKAFAKNPDLSKVVKPAFQIDSSLKSISPFSPDVNSGVRKTLESTKRRDKTSDHGTLTKSRTSVAVAITPQQRYGRSTSGIDQAGDVSGSITKDKSSGPVPNSPLQSFQTRK